MKKLIFILLLLPSSLVLALDCERAISTVDTNACIKLELDKVELQLNQTYQRALKKITEVSVQSPSFTDKTKLKKQFIETQRLWIKFRASDCQTTYTLWSDGTIRGSMYLSCMIEKANQRIKDLKVYEAY